MHLLNLSKSCIERHKQGIEKNTEASFPADVTDLGANSQVTKANNY